VVRVALMSFAVLSHLGLAPLSGVRLGALPRGAFGLLLVPVRRVDLSEGAVAVVVRVPHGSFKAAVRVEGT